MARFFKHVGEHNNKKVVIVQRFIPGEEHMCSVLYSQIIPSQYHDDIMRVLESQEGQASNQFVDILRRRMASNGNNLLEAVAREGYLKKVPTQFVIVKPNAASAIRLDELNSLLTKAGEGEEAVRKLEELDRQQGLKDSRKQNAPMPESTSSSSTDGVLQDVDLAKINIQQAGTMRQEAERLLAEAERLESEAKVLDPSLKVAKRKTSGRKPKTSPA